MKEGLIIGVDLCRDYCRVSFFDAEGAEPQDLVLSEGSHPYTIQNSICKKKGEDTWLIGADAYQTALFGNGTIVDKLLRLVFMGGHATFEGVTYQAEELLGHFISEMLSRLIKKEKSVEIAQIVFTVQELEGNTLDVITRCARSLGIDKKRIHIISHTEAFLYYSLSRQNELRSNLTVLYDLSQDGLNFYEMDVLRGMQPNAAKADRTFLEEGFSPEILETAAGKRMADNIMSNCVSRMLQKKNVSCAYLSGIGMETCQDWGTEFLKVLCQRRRVFYIENLFAKGAVYAAMAYESPDKAYPYSMICEGRIKVDITADVYQGVTQKTMLLAAVGDNWYETRVSFDFIPDQENSLRLKIRKPAERQAIIAQVPFDEFPTVPNKCRRISASLMFTTENTFEVTLRDKGFGELYPPSNVIIRKSFSID